MIRHLRAAAAALLLLVFGTAAAHATANGAIGCTGVSTNFQNVTCPDINEELTNANNRGIIRLSSVSGTNTITANAAPYALTSYQDGQHFTFKPAAGNTGAVTLNINGLGAKAIVKQSGSALASGDLASSTIYTLSYYASDDHFRVMGAVGTPGVDDDVPEAGDYTNLTGGTGITNSPTGTINFDATEISSATWGAGSFTAFTFNAGAVDPVMTMGSGTVTWSAVTTFNLDDEAELRLFEEDANGSNYIGFKPPTAITSNVTCTLENDSSPIPDSCVGNGTDDTVTDGDKGDITVSSSGAAWNIDAGAVAISTDVSGLGTGIATWLGTPSSANLAVAVTDETGSGALVFGTAPTITLANGTGLPISTGVSGLGSNVATALATSSSANWRAAMSDETGTGAMMFGLTTSMADDLSCTGSQVVRRNAGDTAFECANPAGGGDALTTSPLSQFAATTSLQLRGVMSDEVGTGAAMFGLATTMSDDLSCTGNQVVRRNSGDTAFECATLSGTGDLLAANNLSDVASAATAFANIKQSATTTATGVSELATDGEAQAKTDTARVITPSNLAALGASTTFVGLVELATTAEAAAQTDTTRAVTPAGLAFKPESFCFAMSDETTDLTASTNKIKFRMPYAFTITAVRASLSTAATGANLLTVDLNEGGSTILSTKLTFDASETTTTTAATAAVISDTALADDAEISGDVDQIGNTTAGRGLKVCMIGHQ